MIRAFCIAIFMLLGGCATYSEMQQKAPAHESDSSKTSQAFVDCVLPKLVDKQADAHSMKDGDSVVVVLPIGNRGGDLAATVTATPSPEGSHIAVRSNMSRNGELVWSIAQTCM
jgi:hypothetical protein